MTPAPDTPACGDAGPRVSESFPHITKDEAERTRKTLHTYQRFGEVLDDASKQLADRDATIAALRRQVEEGEDWKRAAIRAGVCQSCVHGAPDPEHGCCTDCLNTGWRDGDPYERIADLEARLADAERGGMEKGAADMRERCAQTARDACLVPPDGGSPTEEEVGICDEAERRIRALSLKALSAATPAPQEGKPE